MINIQQASFWNHNTEKKKEKKDKIGMIMK